MAEDDLLDNLDDGGGAPAKKKKLKLPGGGVNMGAFLPTIVSTVVIVVVVFMSGGKGGDNKGTEELRESLEALAKKQGEMIVALNNREFKVEGVELAGFHSSQKTEKYYLATPPQPMTLNVGRGNFARLTVLVVVDKEVAEEMGHAASGGKEEKAAEGGGHGGGPAGTFGQAPEWFQAYAPDIQQAVQFFFAQVDYDKTTAKYTLPDDGGKARTIEFVRQAMVTKINEGLQRDPENRFRLRDIIFQDFVID